MTDRPRLLDLYCCDGGATKGYQEVGFYVVGVDIEAHPKYCGDEFYQSDALTFPLDGFDCYHASPVCKGYSQTRYIHPSLIDTYPKDIPAIRNRFKPTGKPYVIENVKGAPLENPIMLCGTMFGLKVKRHRYFELGNFEILFAPTGCACKGSAGYTAASNGFSSFSNGAKLISVAGHNFCVADAQEAMKMDWSGQQGLAQAVPWYYTRFIGKYLMEAVMRQEE